MQVWGFARKTGTISTYPATLFDHKFVLKVGQLAEAGDDMILVRDSEIYCHLAQNNIAATTSMTIEVIT